MLHESTAAPPAWSSEGLTRSLRWRLVRATSVGAAAFSAAAVGAFVLAQPGNGLSLFSSGSVRSFSPAPCVSCMKKQALAFAAGAGQSDVLNIPAPFQTHVTNPAVD
jgi:hypothetical protein